MACNLIAIGEPLVAFIAPSIPLFEAPAYTAHVVGAETNVAVGVRRLGYAASVVGRVGTDPFGTFIRRRLASEGVSTKYLLDNPGPTGLLFRNHREVPASEVVYRRAGSAGSGITPEDIEFALADASDDSTLHVSGVTPALSASARAATQRALEIARSRGLRVCLDLNYRSRLWEESPAAACLTQLVPFAQIVLGTREEMRMVTAGESTAAMLSKMRSYGPELVVLRDGLDAHAMDSTGNTVTIAGRPLRSVVDPVGAGDGFVAGFLSGIFDGLALEDSLMRAHRCGAAVVNALGDIEGLPTRSDIEAKESDILR